MAQHSAHYTLRGVLQDSGCARLTRASTYRLFARRIGVCPCVIHAMLNSIWQKCRNFFVEHKFSQFDQRQTYAHSLKPVVKNPSLNHAILNLDRKQQRIEL